MTQTVRRLLIVHEGAAPGEFEASFTAGFQAHDCRVDLLPHSADWSASYDLVLGYGPFRRPSGILAITRRLLALSPTVRPVFVWWLTEGTPPPWMPAWLVESASRLRLFLDRWNVPEAGHRLRIFGELRQAQTLGVLDVLAVTSASRANYLRRRGFDPLVVPLGYHREHYGEDLGITRDIDVCFLGNTDAPRRRRLFERVAADLRARGIAVAAHDNLYGGERTLWLNRSKILLNILRAPHDFVGQRFLFGMANKALVVSEPIVDSEPFVSGKHIVTAPVPRLAETIAYYLAHAEERQALTDEAHCFVTRHMTIEQMCGRILARASEACAR